ncbi:MAG: D-aminoacylase [Candidatus Doudnabacteria bacterium]|nr:D-aminoacylase [Candidatus Doudnabacteria bacterium]
MLDILIKNGNVIDGTGAPAKLLDIAIEKGKIKNIAPNITTKSAEIINARDLYVTPGFIDLQNHSDSYWTILDQPDQMSLLSQGITSIIMGNCGASLAPLLSNDSIKTIQKWHNLSGINLNWLSMGEFLKHMSSAPIGVNVGTLVGHSTIRRGLLGDEVRQLTNAEMNVMKNELTAALDQGALGLSMGLVYAHEVSSSTDELEQLAKIVKAKDKYLSVHLRSEGRHILDALDEVIELGANTSVPIKISHLKVRSKSNWPLFDRLMSKIEVAYHQGINISFDVYPYSTSWSVLYTYLPKWAYEGGRDQILKMIAEPISRRKILDHLREGMRELDDVIVAEAAYNENFVGKTLKQVGMNQSVSSAEAVLNILTATKAQVMVFDHNLSDEHVELMCASPLSFIATDGGGYSGKVPKIIHPRCFGTMPRFLKMVRENKIMKWEQAIKKLTSEPAKLLGINDRGVLAVDTLADIAIFDPMTITDRADYQNPDSISEGMHAVIVNGKTAFSQKLVKNSNGQVISR